MDAGESNVAQDSSAFAESVSVAAWWGRCSIPSWDIDINLGVHVPYEVRLKLASMLPTSLCLNPLPRTSIWPEYFTCSPPTELNVDFRFFSSGRGEIVLDNLLNDAICSDLALEAKIGEAKLLVFTSLQLPENLHRLNGKLYFWGIFMARNPFFSQKTLESENHIDNNEERHTLSSNQGDVRSDLGKVGSITIAVGHSPITHSAQVGTRGRPLDDAWRHARAVVGEKIECTYCGFVSTNGGISRLKAHLAGGNPRIHLPGCPKVSPQVKQEMVTWFNEFVKKSKATWLTETPQGPANTLKRGMPLESAWEHAIQLDNTRQHIKCKYCDLVYNGIGGIDRLRVHLGGGDLNMALEGFSNVPLEVKNLMCEDTSQKKVITVEKIQVTQTAHVGTRGRPLDDAWKHAKALEGEKIECTYCGFVSTNGGISRLKAHLAGGNPRIHLPGCLKVSPQVKQEMSTWFVKFVKNSKAVWLRETLQGPAHTLKRERPLEMAWEHAIQLDKMRQRIKCKYCNFVYTGIGGIDRLKVHLGGGDLNIALDGCPNVPLEVKNLMSEVDSRRDEEIAEEKMQVTQTPQVGTRGRPFDDAWRHAKPLENQKIECIYCGFVSTTGGISRMKTHLAGENPPLPGCPKVSPQVKQEMTTWFNEFVKHSKAVWLTKTPLGPQRIFKRGRPLDNAWEHAIPFDRMKHSTKCKYCDFVSTSGGIARLKVHLRGGDSDIALEGCPNVPPEVKILMSAVISQKKAKTKKKIHAPANTLKTGRPVENACEHAIHLGVGDLNIALEGCPYVPSKVQNLMFEADSGKRVIAKAIQGTQSTLKRGRPLDNACEHAMPLDRMRLSTKCKYCDFVCTSGGITRLKVHLGGGDSSIALEGCPNVPQEVKILMSEVTSQKKAKTEKKTQEVKETSEAQRTRKRPHFLQFYTT